MKREELWAHVQEALDEREDPLADERVREGLLEHPELCDELFELRGELDRLPTGPQRSASNWRRVAAVAAALVLASTAIWPFLIEPQAQDETAASEDATSRVHHFELTYRTRTPNRERELRNDNGTLVRRVVNLVRTEQNTKTRSLTVRHQRILP